MSEGKRRVFSREFKLSAVERVLAGERAVAVSREFQVPAGHLYRWCVQFRRGGAEGLRPACRPRKVAGAVAPDPAAKAMRAPDLATAGNRITELERKIGQQQVELDFFRQALRRVGGARQSSDRLGVPASTRSSRR
jgi:transposase